MDNERPYAAVFHGLEKNYFWSPITEAQEVFAASEKSFEDTIAFADAVQSGINRVVRFSSFRNTPDQFLSPERIAKEEKTNCYGNVIMTSEFLEEFGVKHYVAFANGHALILLYDYPNGRSFMVDSQASLRMESTAAVTGGGLPKEWQLDDVTSETLCCDLFLSTSHIIRSIPPDKSQLIAEKSLWLGLNPLDKEHFRGNTAEDVVIPMRVYPSLPGRDVLELYYNSIVHENRNEMEMATTQLEDMSGVYPDIDSGNRLALGRTTVKTLVAEN